MNPAVLFAVATHNSADVEVLISAVGGVAKAMQLLPHLWAIMQTVQTEMAKTPSGPGTKPGGAIGS
jgi:hypothetical protein